MARCHRFLLFLLLSLTGTSGLAGEPYKVPAGTKGNHLILTLANDSPVNSTDNITVRLLGTHQFLSFATPGTTVKHLGAGQTAELSFTFDVARNATLGSTDSLLFTVTDKAGSSWTKTILMSYVGPQDYRLEQNFPNPFNPTTTIFFDIPRASRVIIVLYDVLGREVQRIVDGIQETGAHEVHLSAQSLASGTYFYRMQADPVAGGKSYSAVKKITVLK